MGSGGLDRLGRGPAYQGDVHKPLGLTPGGLGWRGEVGRDRRGRGGATGSGEGEPGVVDAGVCRSGVQKVVAWPSRVLRNRSRRSLARRPGGPKGSRPSTDPRSSISASASGWSPNPETTCGTYRASSLGSPGPRGIPRSRRVICRLVGPGRAAWLRRHRARCLDQTGPSRNVREDDARTLRTPTGRTLRAPPRTGRDRCSPQGDEGPHPRPGTQVRGPQAHPSPLGSA